MKRSTPARALLAALFVLPLVPDAIHAQTPPALTLGEQRTLVMLVNFQDDTRQPYSVAYAQDLVFNSVSSFYLENSAGRAWLSGDVAGWFTLPMSASVCDTTMLSQLANQAAASAGVNLAAYSRHVYMFPGSPCGWAGFANSGSLPTRAWISGAITAQLVAHEIGHNFGLGHAGAMRCSNGPIGEPCVSGELADAVDTMSSGSRGQFNAFHKERLGWLNYGTAPTITTVAGTGTFQIEPLESTAGGPKALKILQATDPSTGYRSWYYVEVRRAIGTDSTTLSGTNALDGVLVRVVSEPSATSYLIDMTPATSQYQDSALAVGQTFTDDQAGISLTPLWVNDTGASIAVTLGPGACSPAAPVVTLSSAQSSAVPAGSTVPYTVSLTNADSQSCGGSIFDLRAAMPTGWSATFGAASLAVAPGASASTTLQVTSPATAAAGSYSFTVAASAGAGSGTAASTYVVAAPLTISASAGSPSYASGSEAIIAVSVYRAGLPVAGATVTFRITPPSGKSTAAKATTDASGAATYVYNIRRRPAGTYSVVATVTVNGASASSTTSFKVY